MGAILSAWILSIPWNINGLRSSDRPVDLSIAPSLLRMHRHSAYPNTRSHTMSIYYCVSVHTYPHIRSLTISRFSCVLFDPAHGSIPQFVATVLVPGSLASQVGGGDTSLGGGYQVVGGGGYPLKSRLTPYESSRNLPSFSFKAIRALKISLQLPLSKTLNPTPNAKKHGIIVFCPGLSSLSSRPHGLPLSA